MPTPPDRPPKWVADAVFYQIFPDRFARSGRVEQPGNLEPWDAPPTHHGYKGGDLIGIAERLDWVQDLGANAIYLNPIFRSGSNHRYHTHDYFVVDPLLGGSGGFDHLLASCRSRGIKVVLDGVLNHASRGFFPFHDIMENGARSPWIDWFHVNGFPMRAYEEDRPPNYAAWWGLHALPKFNTENPQVVEYLYSIGEYWAGRGIDGWRLDVPTEISTPGFWEGFRKRVRAVNPDLYIVGEIWEKATDWIARGDRFDATMNYLFGGWTLAFTIGGEIDAELARGLHYPITPPLDAAAYGAAVERLLAVYPDHANRANLNLLGSHDTPRVLSLARGDATAVVLAMVLLLTFPGAPCIYYGDEIGMEGGQEPASRAAFPWDDPDGWHSGILSSVRSLVAVRHAHPALRHGTYARLPTGSGAGLHWFLLDHPEERVVVAVNAGQEAASVSAPAEPIGNRFETLWGFGGIATEEGITRAALGPRSAAVWRARR
jgi:neopullulanase